MTNPLSPFATDRAEQPRPAGRAQAAPAPVEPGLPLLICASHREPWTQRRVGHAELTVRTTGGLVTALDAALRRLGGRWIATGSEPRRSRAPEDEDGATYEVEQLGLTTREMDGYYSGFSNGVLWPLFHYFLGRVNFDAREWREYERVNARFAAAVARGLEESDGAVAWVHDYHLTLAPMMIRKLRPHARVGFFLHTPFPAFEVFRILPTRQQLLEGLLGADLVGFHTRSYRDAFLEAVQKLVGARSDRRGAVEYRGHRTRTLFSPIGVDVERLSALGQDPRTTSKAQRLRRSVPGDQIVLGIDRLDYSKGILERLAGFERLLERQPRYRGHVTLVQIAVPSRERISDYQRLKRDVDGAVGRLEGRYGDAAWSPVRYITRSFQPDDLAAWYRAADICLVTPLRDGLNLVAKEYVACRVDGGGALVLSEFCGAAEELTGAYFANPFGPDSIADALEQALTDDRMERERRMAHLREEVVGNDVHEWAQGFLRDLAQG